MNKKLILFLISLIFISGCGYFAGNVVYDSSDNDMPKDNISINVHFCPRDDCLSQLVNLAKESYDIKCAFYDLNLPELVEMLETKSKFIPVKLVVDNRNYKKLENLSFVKYDNNNQLMHNKFCIFDLGSQKVLTTGSHNPTLRDTEKNNNNLLVIHSSHLVANYEEEFEELWDLKFSSGDKVKIPRFNSSGIIIENYFCPEDSCELIVAKTLNRAEKRIYFMTYSFTSDEIGSVILNKFKQGLDIKGIMEKTQVSQYSEYQMFVDNGIDVIKDYNKYNMHHKVFIVDDTVITGSYNPTSAGNSRNDENLLIIHDLGLAALYAKEFNLLRNNKS